MTLCKGITSSSGPLSFLKPGFVHWLAANLIDAPGIKSAKE